MAVLVLAFAISGFVRGTVAQVFGVLGLVFGLWAAAWISQWVGQHWQGARPAVAFLALRWLVAALAGLAVAALFQWWGERLGEAVKGGLVGWVDRLGGLFAGAALGLAIVAFVLLAALSLRLPRPIAAGAGGARVTVPLMRGGATACRICAPYFPGTTWLRRRFLAAELRAGRLAADANSTKKI